ncbi:hypothetical protein E2C01_101927 [Portunus trituberculatus]|uniref:Uncharacterized protein n=1 Tax=Portunus trituberculatus TaxID=210409 RepID=A0A5B7KH86_PORTR|nr:hypothetical protein [Portunus trituberculatus]
MIASSLHPLTLFSAEELHPIRIFFFQTTVNTKQHTKCLHDSASVAPRSVQVSAPRPVLLGEEEACIASFTFPKKHMRAGSEPLNSALVAEMPLRCWGAGRTPDPRHAALRGERGGHL